MRHPFWTIEVVIILLLFCFQTKKESANNPDSYVYSTANSCFSLSEIREEDRDEASGK
ncbi:hypothetical protein GTHT12_01303 [Geobacillus thermodenitrificans]|jgi:hypothetical protein|nr:hypothetical protein GTHT12_01303 [Geobacillus thermodenitrificans]KQB93280.1 hypothetical protein GEPA3_1772 [Geobacillus sp. PA-3]MEC5186783.1 hypothetical protein [Geobacillus thermodenitrificans]